MKPEQGHGFRGPLGLAAEVKGGVGRHSFVFRLLQEVWETWVVSDRNVVPSEPLGGPQIIIRTMEVLNTRSTPQGF